MRSERWSSMDDIKRSLSRDSAGPAVCYENGSSYIYDSEGHTLVMGTTGSGKSRRLIIPMVNSYLEYNESAVIVDPKGEVYRNTKEMIPPSYKVYLIDYRNIFSPLTDCFNPLYASYQLYKNGTEEDKYYAEQMVAELAHALYPNLSNKDPFWNDSARTLFIGVALSLFNYAKEEEVHLPSVHAFIAEGNQGGSRTTPPFINRFLRLCQNEQIAMNLESYVSTASETRGGIMSTLMAGMSNLVSSEGVRKFISNDSIHINEFDVSSPFICYIIIPDETEVFDKLAGILTSQLTTHFIKIAEQKYESVLPNRINVVLDELGNIGAAICNLPHLMTASRSRNIRISLVLQSLSQLEDIYGRSKADTILSNVDCKIAFRTSHWETLRELSHLCGEREVYDENDSYRKEPLITESQLMQMETGQALVMISHKRLKFITWLPDFTDIPTLKRKVRKPALRKIEQKECKLFDIESWLAHEITRRILAAEDENKEEKNIAKDNKNKLFSEEESKATYDFVSDILDRKDVDGEKRRQRENNRYSVEYAEDAKYDVTIFHVTDSKKTAKVLEEVLGIRGRDNVRIMKKMLKSSFTFCRMTEGKARLLAQKLSDAGCYVTSGNLDLKLEENQDG